MVESLPEAVRVVAQVRVEGIGQRVAFGLKQQPHPVVLRQGLIHHRRRAVGRDEQRQERRLLRLLHVAVLPVHHILHLLLLVFLHRLAVLLPQLPMQWSGQVSAQRQPPFARRRAGRHIQEQIGEHLPTVIHPVHVRDAGRKHRQRAEDEQVGIYLRHGIRHDALQDAGQLRPDRLRESADARGLRFPHFLIFLNFLTSFS